MFWKWLKWSNLFPNLFCIITMRYFLSLTSFSENCQKPYFDTFSLLTPIDRGMSSYDPKSSSIKKYEIWRVFWIPMRLIRDILTLFGSAASAPTIFVAILSPSWTIWAAIPICYTSTILRHFPGPSRTNTLRHIIDGDSSEKSISNNTMLKVECWEGIVTPGGHQFFIGVIF